MEHAARHRNVQPGTYGYPFMKHDMKDQILDPLHLAELGIPKTPWKHGILNNASDDAREQISEQLKEFKHPLDTARKDNGRSRQAKWFTGERWVSFCAGTGGSPGGPIAIATIVMIIARDMEINGNTVASATPTEPTPTVPAAPRWGEGGGRGRGGRAGRGRGRAAMQAEMAGMARAEAVPVTGEPTGGEVLQARIAQIDHVPTEIEKNSDPVKLALIRETFGSRAQTLINALLAFDAYFAWYRQYKKSIQIDAPEWMAEERALENTRLAIDMQEIVERLTSSSNGHKSFLFHAAMYKCSRDILRVRDVQAYSLSPLELQNAETKRTANTGGARRLTLSKSGEARKPLRGSTQGPMQLVQTKGYSTTMALSTLRKLLATQLLRRGRRARRHAGHASDGAAVWSEGHGALDRGGGGDQAGAVARRGGRRV